MGTKRTIYIGKSITNKAIENQRNFDAFVFVLRLKATYINSCLYKWSYRKVRELLHCNQQKAREVINTAFKLGWIKERSYKGNKEIVAQKLYTSQDKKTERYMLQVVDSLAGKQIYIDRLNKQAKHIKADKPDGGISKSDIAHLIVSLQGIRPDDYCQQREEHKKKPQIFSDVRDIILEIIFLEYVKRCDKALDTLLASSRMVVNDSDEPTRFAKYYKDNGLPMKRIAKLYGGLHMTYYQVARLVHKLKQYGLLEYKQAKRQFLKLKEEDELDVSKFDILNERTGKVENVFMRCWRDKKGDPDTYFLYGAYIYKTRAIVTKKPRKTHKVKQL